VSHKHRSVRSKSVFLSIFSCHSHHFKSNTAPGQLALLARCELSSLTMQNYAHINIERAHSKTMNLARSLLLPWLSHSDQQTTRPQSPVCTFEAWNAWLVKHECLGVRSVSFQHSTRRSGFIHSRGTPWFGWRTPNFKGGDRSAHTDFGRVPRSIHIHVLNHTVPTLSCA
jgi:hypothetical protein